ncbi:MAG: hypothetical protein R3Y10_08630 [Ferrimonas sp.]
MRRSFFSLLIGGFALAGTAHSTPLLSSEQTQFFQQLSQHCGQAYQGSIRIDTNPSAAFTNKTLTMHVRECSDNEIKIPFHVGENHSRTWVITKTKSGLRLKHDHRQPDGTEDPLTQYGGDTSENGTAETQSFPLDAFSLTLMQQHNLTQSLQNVWHLHLNEQRFGYRLTSGTREFLAEFDLSKPVALPPIPWGHQ